MATTRKKMKAAFIRDFNGIDKIEIDEVQIPQPAENEVRISISHAGVNPVDWKICDGLLKNRMEYEFPIILGWDLAGTIESLGKKVEKFKEGDPVFAYARKEIVHDGTFAEYICLNADQVVKKPDSLSFTEASCVPLSALTAWQSLYDTAHVLENETILIHAGAGGIGSFAIQLAKLAKAKVLTTVSPSHFDYVKKLGADKVIDYTQGDFVDMVHRDYPEGVDVIYDTVGGNTLKASYNAVKERGRLVTIIGVVDKALAAQKQLQADFVFVAPNGEELQKIANLFDATKLIPPRIQEVPLENVKAALRKNKEGHTEGKIVLKIG